MSPWKVILATMVIFVCGVVTGVMVIKTQGSHNSASGAPGPGSVQNVLRRLAPLGLTTNQHDQIEKIMKESTANNTAIRKKFAPLLHAEMDRAQQAITNILTPEQQIKYAELLKEREQRPDGREEDAAAMEARRGPIIAIQPTASRTIAAEGA